MKLGKGCNGSKWSNTFENNFCYVHKIALISVGPPFKESTEFCVEPLLGAMSQGARSNLVVQFGQFLTVVDSGPTMLPKPQ